MTETKIFKYITVKFTDEDKEIARKHYDFTCLKNSVTKGKGNLVGALGELCLTKYLKEVYPEIITNLNPTYDYDLIFNNIKIDVKSKRTTAKPLPHYSCGVFAMNTKQDCDLYYFTRVNFIQGECYLLGYYPKQQFFEDSTFRKKGEIEPTSPNNFQYVRNSYCMSVDKLYKIEDLIKNG